ncbi:MAG: FtsX-like permease family protein [Myxococcota bacterium]
MKRLLAILVALAVLAVAFAAALARAGVETRYYTLVGAQLFLVILGVVLISSLFTVLYLVVFGRGGRRWIGDRFSVFVGWTLLRSHRVVPTLGSRLRRAWTGLVRTPRGTAALRLVAGAALLGLARVLDLRDPFNAMADAMSPAFARTVQVAVALLGVALVLAALPPLIRRTSEMAALRLRARTAVTLPTFISIVSVSIGVWALIVVLSVMHGFEEDLREKILRTNAHIVIEPEDPAGVLGDPFLLEDRVDDLAGVTESLAFAWGEVMMSSSTNIAVNVVVKGADPTALARSEQVRGRIDPGSARYLDEPEKLLSDRSRYPLSAELERLDGTDDAPKRARRRGSRVMPGVLLGVELAASLNVDVGSELQIISPDGDVGPTGLRPKLRTFRVAGLVTTGMYEYDQKMAWMAIDDAQRFFNLSGDLNRVEVRLASAEETDAALVSLRQILADGFPGLVAADWKARNKSLFSALQLERIVMFVVLGFIILVASLLIVSSLVMLVVEKSRDIAILKALGASHRSVIRTFLVLGGVIGVIGSLSGVTLGVATCLAIEHLGVPLPQEYYISSLPVQLDPLEVALVGVAAFVVCLLATVYPSREAAALRPVEGLRHG